MRGLANTNRLADDLAWAERCEFWSSLPTTSEQKRGRPPLHGRSNQPLILTGHGVRLNVHQGCLVVRDGFTHYPQQRSEYRIFPGDSHKPSRIVILDGDGSITLDVLGWLAQQDIPLIRLDWRGNVSTVISNSYGPNPKLVQMQLAVQRGKQPIQIASSLLAEKFRNSIDTLKQLPETPSQRKAIEVQQEAIEEIRSRRVKSVRHLLGVEGTAAVAYFRAWHKFPLQWKGTGRRPIPSNWLSVGARTTLSQRKITNRNASHPVNAMLNYAYGVLENHIRMEIVARGYDPTIGYLHATQPDRPALVFDLMEPLRPVVDRVVLGIVQSQVLDAADFTLRNDGVCRLNPALARHLVKLSTAVLAQELVSVSFGQRSNLVGAA